MPLTEHEDWWADPTEYRVVSEADFRRWWAAAAPIHHWRQTVLGRPLLPASVCGFEPGGARKVVPIVDCPDL